MKKLILLLLVITSPLFSDTEKDIKTVKKLDCMEKALNGFESRQIEMVKYNETTGIKFSNFIITASPETYNQTVYNGNIGYQWKMFYIDRITKDVYNVGYSVNVLCYRDAHFIYFNFNFVEFRNAYNGVKDFTLRISLKEFLGI